MIAAPFSAQPKTLTPINMKLPSTVRLLTTCLLLACAAAAGCRNTASGFGKDVENAGEKIQEKVN